jgi:hypothetical protein
MFALLVVSTRVDHVGRNSLEQPSLAPDHMLSGQDTVDEDTVFALLVVSRRVDHVGRNSLEHGRQPSHQSLQTTS